MHFNSWRQTSNGVGALSLLLGAMLFVGGCLVQDNASTDTPSGQNPSTNNEQDGPGVVTMPGTNPSSISSGDGMASVDVPMGTASAGMSVSLLAEDPNALLPLGTGTPSPEYGFEPYTTTLSSSGTFRLPLAQGGNGVVLLRRDDNADTNYDVVPSLVDVSGTSASFSATEFGAYRFATAQDGEVFFNARVFSSLSSLPNCASCHAGNQGDTPKFLGGLDPYDTITNLAPEVPLNGNLPDSYIDPANPNQSHLLVFSKSQEHPGPPPSAEQEALIIEWLSLES